MLTDENKAFILKKINEGIQDYVVLANLLYNREDLTGRSKEAKLVRDFLLTTGFVKKQGLTCGLWSGRWVCRPR